jgi:hypothetical protein
MLPVRSAQLPTPGAVAAAAVVASLLGLLAGTSPAAQAQTEIEDLERKLEEARQRKQREAELRRQNQAQRPPPAPAPPANSGRVVVDVDAACELRVNGERVRALQAGDTTTITVPAGQQLIECLSTTFAGVKARSVVEVATGRQVVLTLAVRDAENQSPAGAKAACDRGERSAMQQGSGSGVLRQCITGLEWTAQDNGGDVDWSEAQSHCRGLGGGWSLPTVEQLRSLYDARLPGLYCRGICKVSNQFRLSSYWFWSSERNGSAEAWTVFLDNGNRNSYYVGGRNLGRALCVRRP